MAAVTVTAVPAVSGDWKSTYFSSDRLGETSRLSASSLHPLGTLSFSADRDYGRLVLGGSYSRGNAPAYPGLGRTVGEEQFSLRAGYDFGNSLGYVSLGRQQSQGQFVENESEVLGIGMRVSLNRALQLTGEYLHHRKPAEAATGLSASRLTIGAAFRF